MPEQATKPAKELDKHSKTAWRKKGLGTKVEQKVNQKRVQGGKTKTKEGGKSSIQETETLAQTSQKFGSSTPALPWNWIAEWEKRGKKKRERKKKTTGSAFKRAESKKGGW